MVLRPAGRWARARYAELRALERRVLLVGLAVAACAWIFVALADAITDGGVDFDERGLRLLRSPGDPSRPRGPAQLAGAARDVTALGSGTVLVGLTSIVALGLLAAGRRRQAVVVLGACLSGLLLASGLKLLFDRERPDEAFHAVETWTSSFPSGHSMNAAVVYLTLGALVAEGQTRRRVALFALATGIVLAVLVALSRVYLGVHHPTDVAAGLAAGFGWASLWWLAADRIRARRAREAAR